MQKRVEPSENFDLLSKEKNCQVAVIGAGLLGVNISFWLSYLYDNCSIVLIDREMRPARHTSSRNTGVVHRPFYLNPNTKRIFAGSAQKSYPMWAKLASRFGLPWKQVGMIRIAAEDAQVPTIEKYHKWAVQNGMNEDELEVLSAADVKRLEPEVECKGGILSKFEPVVQYGTMTECVFELAVNQGVKFLGGYEVQSIRENNGTGLSLKLVSTADPSTDSLRVNCDFAINVAGSCAIDIAHMVSLGKEYTDLHFRGWYWRVDEPFASRVTRLVYPINRYTDLPSFAPHFVIRTDGVREIGPAALLVWGPFSYEKFADERLGSMKKLFERPNMPKFKLLTSGKFLSLVRREWKTSLFKSAMSKSVARYIPRLTPKMLNTKGLVGIRSWVINNQGFVSEALRLENANSLHVLNYNSPGATGSPAFSAYLVEGLRRKGHFDGLHQRTAASERSSNLWNFEEACAII